MPAEDHARSRLLTITERRATFRAALAGSGLCRPSRSFAGPAAMLSNPPGGAALSRRADVACGLLIAYASTKWRCGVHDGPGSVLVTYSCSWSAAALRAEALFLRLCPPVQDPAGHGPGSLPRGRPADADRTCPHTAPASSRG